MIGGCIISTIFGNLMFKKILGFLKTFIILLFIKSYLRMPYFDPYLRISLREKEKKSMISCPFISRSLNRTPPLFPWHTDTATLKGVGGDTSAVRFASQSTNHPCTSRPPPPPHRNTKIPLPQTPQLNNLLHINL